MVASPDARRVFVANSGQDTITVLDVAARKLVGHVDLRKSLCNAPDKARTFQPRGMAVTKNSKRLFVTRFLSFTRPGGVQADDNGREGAVCRLDIKTASSKIADYKPAKLVKLAPQVTGFTIDANGDGVADPTSAFPNQLQSIVIKGNNAYLPNIAASPTGAAEVQRGHPGVRQRHRRRQHRLHERPERGQVHQPPPGRAQPRAGQEEALLRQRLGHRRSPAATRTPSRPAATSWSRPASTGRASSTSRSTPTRPATST